MEVSNKDGIKIVYGILFLNAINNKNNPEQKNKIEKNFNTIRFTPNTFIIKPSNVGCKGAFAKQKLCFAKKSLAYFAPDSIYNASSFANDIFASKHNIDRKNASPIIKKRYVFFFCCK